MTENTPDTRITTPGPLDAKPVQVGPPTSDADLPRPTIEPSGLAEPQAQDGQLVEYGQLVDGVPQDLTPEDEAERLTQTNFPDEEFDLPDQTPEDQGQNQETTDGNDG